MEAGADRLAARLAASIAAAQPAMP
jgi:hypothetical protein